MVRIHHGRRKPFRVLTYSDSVRYDLDFDVQSICKGKTLTLIAKICVASSCIVFVLSGCSDNQQKTGKTELVTKSSSENSKTEVEQETSTDKEDVAVVKYSLADLINQYESNSEELNNKLIETSGLVLQVRTETFTGKPMFRIMLAEKANDSKPFNSLNADSKTFFNCYVSDPEDFVKNNFGQRVTLRGRIADSQYLIDCKVVSKGGTPIPRMKTSEFAKQFSKGKKEFLAKHKDSFFVIEGVVDRHNVKETVGDYSTSTVLQGDEKTEIGLHRSDSGLEMQFKEVKSGDEIVVIGQLLIGDDDPKSLPIGLKEASRLDFK